MKIFEFVDYEDFAFRMIDSFRNLNREFTGVSAIAKYENARHIIEELVSCRMDLFDIEICSPFVNGYNDEYVITLDDEGVWCEPMKHDGKYYDVESEIIYIFDDCSSKVLSHCDADVIFEVSVDDEENNDIDEDDVCCGCDRECYECPYDLDEFDFEYVENEDKCVEDNEIYSELCSFENEMPGFTVNQSDENGSCSFSFYSTDMDLVREMAKMFKK